MSKYRPGPWRVEPRCNAATGKGMGQCRCTKDLTRTRVTVYRAPHFVERLTAEAIVELCPKHLKLNFIERLALTESAGRSKAPRNGASS